MFQKDIGIFNSPPCWQTTTQPVLGWLNARKKHNLPYIETIHISGLEHQLSLAQHKAVGAAQLTERFIIVAWKMLKSFLKKRMLLFSLLLLLLLCCEGSAQINIELMQICIRHVENED